MSRAKTAAMAARRSTSRPRPARQRSRARTTGVRWDRVGRVALLMVLGGVLLLYVGPARSYWETWRESKTRTAELRTLQQENRRLLERRRQLRDPQALEREARALGMVREGERAFVVEGLPRTPRAP